MFSPTPPPPAPGDLAGCLLCVPLPSPPGPRESTQPCALINPAAVCVHCSAHSASRWVSTCWRHQRGSTQEMWLQSLQQGRKWAKQERKYLSVKHVQSAVFSDSSGYLVTVQQHRLWFSWNVSKTVRQLHSHEKEVQHYDLFVSPWDKAISLHILRSSAAFV